MTEIKILKIKRQTFTFFLDRKKKKKTIITNKPSINCLHVLHQEKENPIELLTTR